MSGIKTELLSVTTVVPGKAPVVEYENPQFKKKSKREKRQERRQRERKKRKRDPTTTTTPASDNKQDNNEQRKKRRKIDNKNDNNNNKGKQNKNKGKQMKKSQKNNNNKPNKNTKKNEQVEVSDKIKAKRAHRKNKVKNKEKRKQRQLKKKKNVLKMRVPPLQYVNDGPAEKPKIQNENKNDSNNNSNKPVNNERDNNSPPNPTSGPKKPWAKKNKQREEEDEMWAIWAGDYFNDYKSNITKNYKNKQAALAAAEALVEGIAVKNNLDQFEKHILKSGTMTDRISAWAVMFREAPLIRLPLLPKLLKWATRKNRREKEIALKSLEVLFTSEVMPERQLQDFMRHNFKRRISSKTMCMWYLESKLKDYYKEYVGALEEGMKDHMDWFRVRCLVHTTNLLKRNAENEKLKLMLLVRKLGDHTNKVCSGALRQIQLLLNFHPSMKTVVAKEIQDLLRRSPNHRCKNYALTLLSEFVYQATDEDKQAASTCIRLFITIFRDHYIKGQAELTSKHLTALFTGLRRAFPYAEPDPQMFESSLKEFYRLAHTAGIATSVQTLLALRQIEASSGDVSTRFYRTLYSILLRPKILFMTKPHLLLHVLYVSIKNDPNLDRACAFIKRLFQLSSNHSTPFACGSILLINECLKIHTALRNLFNQDVETTNESPLAPKQSDDAKSHDDLYHPEKVEPLYSNSTRVPLWEISLFTQHYHPSAKIWADKTVASEDISYSGDPLIDFTPTAFLYRYSYKKAKKISEESVFARQQKVISDTARDLYDKDDQPAEAVNPQDIFFHKYFVDRKKLDPELYKRREMKVKDVDEYGEVDEAEQDRIMLKVMKERFGVDAADLFAPGGAAATANPEAQAADLLADLDDTDWALLQEQMGDFADDKQAQDMFMGDDGDSDDFGEDINMDDDFDDGEKVQLDTFMDAEEFQELLLSGKLDDFKK